VIDVQLTAVRAQQPCGEAFGVDGYTQIGRLDVHANHYLAMLAAGELAEQRWLREAGLSTPARAWAVERGAQDDVAKAVERLRELRPGLEEHAYRQLYWQYRPDAQRLVDENWDRILAVAGPLAERGRLDGDDAADLAALPNPAEPPAS